MDAASTTSQDESPLRELHHSERGRQPAATDAVFITRQDEPLVRQPYPYELNRQPVIADTILSMPQDQSRAREQGRQPAVADAVSMILRQETPLHSAMRRINFLIPPVT